MLMSCLLTMKSYNEVVAHMFYVRTGAYASMCMGRPESNLVCCS